MKRILLLAALVCAGSFSVTASATPGSENDSIPKAISVVTHRSIKIGNQLIAYTATVGSLILQDPEGKPIASIGYTAYVKDGETDLTKRPVTFAYNGGPGSSSMWLHLGVLGPRRVVVEDPANRPAPPYQLTDNAYSIIDVTDLIMIDPVGTGISKAVGKAKSEDFWGVNQDIKSVSEFIKLYIKKNNRWNSPKFLLGESYGTTRSAGVVDYLQASMGIAFNGVMLVSVVLQFNTLSSSADNDLAYISFLPTFAAVAWYHNQIPRKGDLKTFLQEVREFTAGAYKDALFAGANLAADKRKEVIARLHQYTGLDEAYWDRANLRVKDPEFMAELLRKNGKTTGRLDARYTGESQNLLSEYSDHDPQSSAISPPYVAMFLNYYHNELKAPEELDYHVNAYGAKGFKWDWKRGGDSYSYPSGVTTAPDLQNAMTKNPQLRVVLFNGYYDLATPFYGAEYTMDHLNLAESTRKNVTMKYYEAGHMMYIEKASLPQFKADVAQFILGH